MITTYLSVVGPKVKNEVEYTAKLTSSIPAGRVVARAVAGGCYIRTALNSNYERDYYG